MRKLLPILSMFCLMTVAATPALADPEFSEGLGTWPVDETVPSQAPSDGSFDSHMPADPGAVQEPPQVPDPPVSSCDSDDDVIYRCPAPPADGDSDGGGSGGGECDPEFCCPKGELPDESGNCSTPDPPCPNEEPRDENGECPAPDTPCPNEEAQDESGKCPEPSDKECPDGQSRDEDGECSKPPDKKCPNQEAQDESGKCPKPSDEECTGGQSKDEDGECPKSLRSNIGSGGGGSGGGEGKGPDPGAADPGTKAQDGRPQIKGTPDPETQQFAEMDIDPDMGGPSLLKPGGSNFLAQQPAGTLASTVTDPDVVSPSPLKSGATGMGTLLAIFGLATAGFVLARWVRGVQGKSKVQGKPASNKVVERTTDAGADAVKAFAESRTAAKTGGGSSSEDVPSETAPGGILVPLIPGKRIRLLIADEHPVVRSKLRGTLEDQPDFEVVGEATTGTEAVRLTKRLHPRVVLMDLHMPQMGSVTAIAQIKAKHRDACVLAMITRDDDADIPLALEAGASGYLLKDTPREELFEAIRAATRGKPLLVPTRAVRSTKRK